MKIENFSKIIFHEHNETNNLYTLPLGTPRHDCRRNMDAELPVVYFVFYTQNRACATYIHFGICFARARVCMQNTKYWEFSSHILQEV